MALSRLLPALVLAISLSLGIASTGWCPVAEVTPMPQPEPGRFVAPPNLLSPIETSIAWPSVVERASPPAPIASEVPPAQIPSPCPGAGRVAVLIYHNVCTTDSGLYTVSPDRLRRDLSWVLSQGWQPLDFDGFAAWYAGGVSLSGDYFLLTFDDGYQGVADHALPVLVDMGVPAVLFLTTGQMDSGSGLTTAGARALADSGLFSLQNHTHGLHYQIDAGAGLRAATCVVPAEQLVADLQLANEIIQSLGAPDPIAFAWPYGEHTTAATQAARALLPLIFGTQERLAQPGDQLIGRFGLDWRGHAGVKALFLQL